MQPKVKLYFEKVEGEIVKFKYFNHLSLFFYPIIILAWQIDDIHHNLLMHTSN